MKFQLEGRVSLSVDREVRKVFRHVSPAPSYVPTSKREKNNSINIMKSFPFSFLLLHYASRQKVGFLLSLSLLHDSPGVMENCGESETTFFMFLLNFIIHLKFFVITLLAVEA